MRTSMKFPQNSDMSDQSPHMVRLRLDVESMRYSVMQALVDHQGEVQKRVEAEITELVTNGHLEHKIKESVRRHLDTAIDEAVKHAFSSWAREAPTVQQAIRSAVTDALAAALEAGNLK